ncbi:DUF427 domain-containing protein [Mesobacterium pallidum]|uniref:DUF427 domain-containing protein n=1 Tax=Mesobacterium pallidum TaxID=2872037 RepID=UPI001EE2C1D9|nr:DUF427 domain-containing protein [Mesobacterium pallidum]
MNQRIHIHAAKGTWTVRAGGAVLVESSKALELHEADMPFVVYFPREDIAMAFLEKTGTASHCPFKGDASYYSIVTKSTTIPDAAWSYESPKAGLEQIAGHLAFYATDQVTVERI